VQINIQLCLNKFINSSQPILVLLTRPRQKAWKSVFKQPLHVNQYCTRCYPKLLSFRFHTSIWV